MTMNLKPLVVMLLVSLLILSQFTHAQASSTEDDGSLPHGWWNDWIRDRDMDHVDDVFYQDNGPGDIVDIIVDYIDFPDLGDLARLNNLGIQVEKAFKYIPSVWVKSVPFELLPAIARLPNVGMVEKDLPIYPTLDKSTKVIKARPTDLEDDGIKYHDVWDELDIEGEGISVAIMDTGVDNGGFLSHDSLDDLDDNSATNDPKFLAGIDYTRSIARTDGSFDPDDVQGHGTHTAGIAIGTGDGAEDGAYRGVAPKARLVDVKVMENWGQGSLGSLIDGLEWVTDKRNSDFDGDGERDGIDIVSMSLGSSETDDGKSSAAQAVNAAAEKGLVCIVSIGNDDSKLDSGNANLVPAPSSADKAIVVGAINDNNTIDRTDDIIADYSYSGPRPDDGDTDPYDELKPDVVAPGSNIMAPQANSKGAYVSHSGTSMATPLVSGIVALMMEANPDLKGAENSRDVTDLVKEYLRESAEARGDPYDVNLSLKYNEFYGFGMVDAYRAVKLARDGSLDDIDPPIIDPDPPGPGTPEVNATKPLVAIASPSADREVGAEVFISGSAALTDGSITSVRLQIGNQPQVIAIGLYDWLYQWDTTLMDNGPVSIVVSAYNELGGMSSAWVNVTVYNSENVEGGDGGDGDPTQNDPVDSQTEDPPAVPGFELPTLLLGLVLALFITDWRRKREDQ